VDLLAPEEVGGVFGLRNPRSCALLVMYALMMSFVMRSS
jgi:hypothetical protein